MSKLRHYFAGSNTSRGFYSLFENIIREDAKRIYLLKGGPGTGKSRFMADLAQTLGDLGHDRELFFCSSDSNSLDGVAFPKLGVAIIDATSPHALEARWPGCRDQLICLGNFWNPEGLSQHRTEIIHKGLEKQSRFAKAFRYFAAAQILEENIMARNNSFQAEQLEFLGDILARLDQARESYQTTLGPERKLFASALTPEGYVSHVHTLVADYEKLYILTGALGTGRYQCLAQIRDHARRVGLAVEVFPYPLDPGKTLHLLIPQLKLGILTSIDLDPLAYIPGMPVDFGMGAGIKLNSQDNELFRELLDLGIQALKEAQEGHIQVEQYYGEHMDFKALDSYKAQVLEEILGL